MHHAVRVGRRRAIWILGTGRILEAHQHSHFNTERLLVELECLFGTAVEEQIDLALHDSFLLPKCEIRVTVSFSAPPSARRPPCDGRSPRCRRNPPARRTGGARSRRPSHTDWGSASSTRSPRPCS